MNEMRRTYLNRELVVGDRVWIYEDPITQLKVEGHGTVRSIRNQRAGGVRVMVMFDDSLDTSPVERFIAFPLCGPVGMRQNHRTCKTDTEAPAPMPEMAAL